MSELVHTEETNNISSCMINPRSIFCITESRTMKVCTEVLSVLPIPHEGSTRRNELNEDSKQLRQDGFVKGSLHKGAGECVRQNNQVAKYKISYKKTEKKKYSRRGKCKFLFRLRTVSQSISTIKEMLHT